MKGSLRKQLRTPVGNKTKRGAELEGTPKTPRIDSVSPVRSASAERGLLPQEDHLKLPPTRTRRLLHWSVAKQPPLLANVVASAAICAVDRGCVSDLDSLQQIENSSAPPSLQQLKSGDPFKSAALSPLCLNAIPTSSDLHTERQLHVKKPTDVHVKHPDPASRERASEDAGLRNERVFFWSNPAFNQIPAAVAPSKGATASGSGSSSSASSTSFQVQETDFGTEADDCRSDAESCPMSDDEDDKRASYDARDGSDRHPIKASIAKDGGAGDLGHGEDVVAADSDMTEAMDNSPASNGSSSNDACEQKRSAKRPETEDDTARAAIAERKEDGGIACQKMLLQIDKEIERLTMRLTELVMERQKWEEEMKKQRREGSVSEAPTTKAMIHELASTSEEERNGAAETGDIDVPKRRTASEKQPRSTTSAVGMTTARGKQKPSARGAEAIAKDEKGGGGESPASSMAVQRRLSLSAAGDGVGAAATRTKQQRAVGNNTMATPSRAQGTSSTTAATPLRMVSSRHGGAIRAKSTTVAASTPVSESSKKRDRSCGAMASSSPMLLLQHQQHKQQTAGKGGSPVKRVATMRRAQTACAAQQVAATPPGSTGKGGGGGDSSPKSTAALYQCLESLVEDSKNFFKRISPARRPPPPHASSAAAPPPVAPLDCLHGSTPSLRTISTCRFASPPSSSSSSSLTPPPHPSPSACVKLLPVGRTVA